jgi:hypothetical protein
MAGTSKRRKPGADRITLARLRIKGVNRRFMPQRG